MLLRLILPTRVTVPSTLEEGIEKRASRRRRRPPRAVAFAATDTDAITAVLAASGRYLAPKIV